MLASAGLHASAAVDSAVADTAKMAPIVARDVAIPMRDGTILRGDLYRPAAEGRHPVLVYRTPYGKQNAAQDYQIHLAAVRRGYAVLLQDVRGRYQSDLSLIHISEPTRLLS